VRASQDFSNFNEISWFLLKIPEKTVSPLAKATGLMTCGKAIVNNDLQPCPLRRNMTQKPLRQYHQDTG
jgi:hypothetical protein